MTRQPPPSSKSLRKWVYTHTHKNRTWPSFQDLTKQPCETLTTLTIIYSLHVAQQIHINNYQTHALRYSYTTRGAQMTDISAIFFEFSAKIRPENMSGRAFRVPLTGSYIHSRTYTLRLTNNGGFALGTRRSQQEKQPKSRGRSKKWRPFKT